MKITISNILGKIEDGVLIMLDIEYFDKYYEGTLWYNDEVYILTPSNELDEIVNIKTLDEFPKLFEEVRNLAPIYQDVISTLEDII